MNAIRQTLTFMFLIWGIHLFGEDTNQWDVQVTRLVVASTPIMVKTNLSGKVIPEKTLQDLKNLRAHNGWSPGVTVNLRVTAPKGQIVDDIVSDSAIESFTDDKGKDLLLNKESSISEIGFSEGTPSLSVELKAPNLPSKGATELTIIGKVVAKTASQSKQFSVENVTLKAGTKLNLGDLHLSISDVGMRDKKFEVTSEASQDLSAISSLAVFDKHGKEIKASLSKLGEIRDAKTHVVELSELALTLDKRLENAKITATCWMDLKTTEVPTAVKVGLGL